MELSKCKTVKAKSIELLNAFYFQNECKYKFRPDIFNDLLFLKDKLNEYSPKSSKFFKKILKSKNSKIKKRTRNDCYSYVCDVKSVKKFKDEQNVNDALQEVTVLDKIFLLKMKGIWSREALPKLMEPNITKTQWDYLNEEFEWLSIDMKNRLHWKIIAAKTLAQCAKIYVLVKEEIKSLENIQIQEDGRLVCSRIAKMIKEWWNMKKEIELQDSNKLLMEVNYDNSAKDFCQVWLSKNFINHDNVDYELDISYDKSDSDSLCSFNSSRSYSSIMLTDEEYICEEERTSFDMTDVVSSTESLIDELNWLEDDMKLYDCEMKLPFENEIDELKILSQLPLEKIIDENYYLHNDVFDGKSTTNSDFLDGDSLKSETSNETTDIFIKSESMLSSFIASQSEKIQEILTSLSFTDLVSVSTCSTLDKLIKHELVNFNVQILLELIKQKCSFSIVSSLQCGDDRFVISVLFNYLSFKFNIQSPDLIITTNAYILEWQSLLTKINPKCKIIILDLYLSYQSADRILERIENTVPLFCIISYSALCTNFCVTAFKWNNIIYDQVEQLCDNLLSIPENIFLSNIDLVGVRIGLISEDKDFLNKKHCLKSYFRLFYTTTELSELMKERKTFREIDKLKTIALNHCIPLKRMYNLGSLYQVILCELSPFQNRLHNCVVSKLKKSLESNNLLDIAEAICQDIQLSQHPFLFDYSSDNEESKLFHSLNFQNKQSNSMLTYNLSHNDTLYVYLPKHVLKLINMKEQKVSNKTLLYQWRDESIFCFTKYERLLMKNLIISTANIDNFISKISTCLNDIDDENNLNFHKVYDVNSNCLDERSQFLSDFDIENLKFEFNYANENRLHSTLNGPNILIPESIPGLDNCDKDLYMTSTLAARKSKTKFKSRLTNLAKDNEKYSIFLDCSDWCYLSIKNIVSLDLGLNLNEFSCLRSLCSISRDYIFSNKERYAIVRDKVVARAPKLTSNCKSKYSLSIKESDIVKSIIRLFENYLEKIPKSNTRLQDIKKDELYLSGKLQILNNLLSRLANDSSIKTCIIISHSFDLLNMIESLIFINNNYNVFARFRLNSFYNENDNEILSTLKQFNKYILKNKKAILLMHSRTNYQLLVNINIMSCSIIIADSHWQTDSDQVVIKLINRWGLNGLFSQEKGICSIYRLSSLETVEQYFLMNDLSFLYENSYTEKISMISTASAIVCQQSLLKFFVDKLLPPLKEQLISGFCVDDFQAVLQKRTNFIKLSNESINDILNSFENAYDLLLLCNYQSTKKLSINEFKNLEENSENYIVPNRISQKIENEIIIDSATPFIESLRKWETHRIKRKNRLNHLKYISDDQNFILFYDSKQLQLHETEIWMPLQLCDTKKIAQTEIFDTYGLEPIQDTELSSYLIPTKSYLTKSNHKKWDDKVLSLNTTIKEDSSIATTLYSDIDRVRKRKLSSEYQGGEYCQYSLNHQKKRKFFTNRYKFEKKNVNELELNTLDTKELPDTKKPSPVIRDQPLSDINTYSNVNQPAQPSQIISVQSNDVVRSNSIILCANDSSIKINLQRPFYCKEGLRNLKIKRQQISSGNISNLSTKTNVGTGTNIQNFLSQQRPSHNHRGQLFLNNKLGNNSDANSQSNGENEYEKLPEWNIHEEAVLYQNISHYQDHQLSSNISDKFNSLPNFKICENYLNFYSITSTHRSNEMCKIHFSKLQMGFLNQNKGDNSISRLNRNSIISNPTNIMGIRTEARPVIGGVAGRKLKTKMKNSIGTYGTSIFGSTQAMTNKIKMFQCFLNDMKVNLTQTNQIVNSCLNSFDNKTTMTFKMLEEVVNISKLPSLLPNHSQTIKKNATHISALEEHNIHPDKIFTPAMLIQRREEIDKERETESNHLNSNLNRQQILTSVSTSYRNVGYFETNPINSSTHSLNHIRRTTSASIGNAQNLYALQTTSNIQVPSRPRYNLPINRPMTGTTVIHQNNNQIQSSVSALATNNISNITSVPSTTISQNQCSSIGSRSQPVQFQIQHSRNSSVPRRTSSQVIQKLVYPGNIHNYSSLRQNQIMNRGSTAFVRPIVPTVVNQSNAQNTTASNSIITVFPNSHDPSSTGISRPLDRGVNFNISNQIRGHNVRTNIATVSSSSRANINQIPRMLHVNQINRNNMNMNNNRNQEQ